LGAAVHVRLIEHEIEVCAYRVGEGKGAEASNVGLGEIEGLFVGGRRVDVVVLFVGVGANVGVENAVGASCHDPCRIVVTAEAFEGDTRAYKSNEFARR